MPASLRALLPPDYDLSDPEIAAYFERTLASLVTTSCMSANDRSLLQIRNLRTLINNTLDDQLQRHPSVARVIGMEPLPNPLPIPIDTIRREALILATRIRDRVHQVVNIAPLVDEQGRPLRLPTPDVLSRNLEDLKGFPPRTWALHEDSLILDFPDVWFNEAIEGRNAFPLGHYRFTFNFPNGFTRAGYSFVITMVSGNRTRTGAIHTNGSEYTDFCMGTTFGTSCPIFIGTGNVASLYDLCRGFLSTWNPNDFRNGRSHWFLGQSGTDPDPQSRRPVYRPFPNYIVPPHIHFHLNQPAVWNRPTSVLAIFHPERVDCLPPSCLFGMAPLFHQCNLPIVNLSTTPVPTPTTPDNTPFTIPIQHLPLHQMLVLSALVRSVPREQPPNPTPPRGAPAGTPGQDQATPGIPRPANLQALVNTFLEVDFPVATAVAFRRFDPDRD